MGRGSEPDLPRIQLLIRAARVVWDACPQIGCGSRRVLVWARSGGAGGWLLNGVFYTFCSGAPCRSDTAFSSASIDGAIIRARIPERGEMGADCADGCSRGRLSAGIDAIVVAPVWRSGRRSAPSNARAMTRPDSRPGLGKQAFACISTARAATRIWARPDAGAT